MKLRLLSRLLVVSLVVVVGIIIIIHQHAETSGAPHPAQPKPTVAVGSVGRDAFPVVWSSEVSKYVEFVEVEGS
jgi:hypothetical protein